MENKKLKKDTLDIFEASNKLSLSFHRYVANYIERCHLKDGGYFFARVLPSSGLDTYFAVKGFSILGMKPGNPESIANFFLDEFKEGAIVGMTNIFVSVETLSELGMLTDDLKEHAQKQIMLLQNKDGSFGTLENIDVEVMSELHDTYRAIKVMKIISANFDKNRITNFILNELNPDGGYGREGRSTLSSTYYATEIHKLLGNDSKTLTVTRDYLQKREQNWEVQFIEDIYWLVLGLANLGEKTHLPERITNFVMECQRENGGFSRSTVIGIPTLEYTFYALKILQAVGVI
jgi:hypothetical protein